MKILNLRRSTTMKSSYIALIAIAIVSLYCGQASTYEINKIIENVPPKDLQDLFKFYLKTMQEYPQDQKTHEKILKEWLIHKYGAARNKRSAYGTEICFPNGQCIDIGDSGLYP